MKVRFICLIYPILRNPWRATKSPSRAAPRPARATCANRSNSRAASPANSPTALPLPCGVTFWAEEQSLFVGFGMVFLLGVLITYAHRERRMFGVGLGVAALVGLAFFSLGISNDRSFEWTILGGVAGEFWVSALMIVSFFFRMPDRLRWDFFRMLLIFPAFATWWSATRLWFGVAFGSARMPTGTIFGGSHDGGGDLNRLMSQYGWSEGGLTSFYTTMSILTGAVLERDPRSPQRKALRSRIVCDLVGGWQQTSRWISKSASFVA